MKRLVSQLRRLEGLVEKTRFRAWSPCSRIYVNSSTAFFTACRHYSEDVQRSRWKVYPVESRGMIRLVGMDTVPFLQGLVTNDVSTLGNNKKSLYTLMLNVQGRVLYDLMMYHCSDVTGDPYLLLECDASITTELIKLMKRYKIRKKIDIADVSDNHKVFAACSIEENVRPDNEHHGILSAVQDPRLSVFGWRVVVNDPQSMLNGFGISDVEPEEDYHRRRYQWGIGEGVVDLPPGDCFPLESNALFLNGLCFEKGCYIGQELTARTYHTGVTRKRLVPLLFDVEPQNLLPGTKIVTDVGKSAGKMRGCHGRYGLGILRMSEAKKNLSVKTEKNENLTVKSHIPEWWPEESVT